MEPVTNQTAPSADAAVRTRARELGFDVVGVARADQALEVEHERYLGFLEQGMHGAMAYLAAHAGARRRLDGEEILPGARSVICVGRRYGRAARDEAGDAPLAHGIARYARGQDYHKFLRRRLQRLAAFVRGLGDGTQARPLCDVEPVLERVWAARAGLGFVGKNGLVITPGQGSYQLIGEVVTTLELTPDSPLEERCGSCTRCLDACPTGAFRAPFVLDPRRCVSYLTIELHEPPPEPLRGAMGEHLFGCDDCQEVCPFNRPAAAPPADTSPFRPLARWGALGLEALAKLDEAGWRSASEGTPLRRAGRVGLARAAALVAAARLRAGATGDAAEDAKRALAAALCHDDAGVREVARWAQADGDIEGARREQPVELPDEVRFRGFDPRG